MSLEAYFSSTFRPLTYVLPSGIKQVIKKALRNKSVNFLLSYVLYILKGKSIPIEKLLQGGDGKIPGMKYATIVPGYFLRPSTLFIEGSHVKFLQTYEQNGGKLSDDQIKKTDYYQNVVNCVKYAGHYFGCHSRSDLKIPCRKFIEKYESEKRHPKLSPITVFPVQNSSYYQVFDGHHRAAIAHMMGKKKIRAFVLKPPVQTPAQDLLSDVMWLQTRALELYQPVDLPELKEKWALVRQCTDRLDYMETFLRKKKWMPGKGKKPSYLDVGCSYGWFVKEMKRLGFEARGVERDYFGRQVGIKIYGLNESDVSLDDIVNFLDSHKKKVDVVSCYSVMHHYVMNDFGTSPAEFLQKLDRITGKVLFFDTGQEHEVPLKDLLPEWNDEYIINFIKKHTSFKKVEPLGKDHDARGKFKAGYSRTTFACTR